MESYKRWVRRNKDFVLSLDSLANGFTWLLPERFSESEIGPEAVTSLLGIFSSVNDHIINSAPTKRQNENLGCLSFPYTLCMTLLKDVETLVEVVAQQLYGEDKKWNFIAIIEAIKVMLRLAMFQKNGYKMLLHGGEVVNESEGLHHCSTQYQHGHLSIHEENQRLGSSANIQEQNPWSLEGRARTALSRFGANARMISEPTWLHRIKRQHAFMDSQAVVKKRPTLPATLSERGLWGGLFVIGEVMFIIRPLLYVMLIKKYGTCSWFPWLTSLALDFTSMGIFSFGTSSWSNTKDKQFHLSDTERDEMRRRKLMWALYLMRDPFFSAYTRKRLESSERLFEPVPVFGFLAGKIIELLTGAQTRYTYVSGS